jgi:exopolyphosphatase/guanosine-5'-triphosphate,3'-diphosphate pyrophosphatase
VIYLVRNARAVKRSRFSGLDPDRELADAGRAQARGLVARLRGAPFGRLIAGPERRCRETLEPLASERGLEIESDGRAGAAAGAAALLDLLREQQYWPTVVCAHGAAIEGALGEAGVDLRRTETDKGSLWVLEGGIPPRRAQHCEPVELERGARKQAVRRAALRPRGRRARMAVLDLGSTSFHLLVADVTSSGDLDRVARERSMLRLGASLGDGRISEEIMVRALEAATVLRDAAVSSGAECLLPVATSALRDAHNGGELASRLGEVLHAPVRLLSGEREARLIFAALRRRLPWRDETVLGADLGGGSLELIAGDEAGVHWEATLPIGVARLHRELVERDPMGPEAARRIRDRVRDLADPYREKIESASPLRAIASGGTIGALVRRLEARRAPNGRAVRGARVRRADLLVLIDELVPSTHTERLALAGLDPRRADLLPTGALVLHTLAEALDIDGYTWSDWGLREGILLETLGLASGSAP